MYHCALPPPLSPIPVSTKSCDAVPRLTVTDSARAEPATVKTPANTRNACFILIRILLSLNFFESSPRRTQLVLYRRARIYPLRILEKNGVSRAIGNQ